MTAQQFICRKCSGLSNVPVFEKTKDGVPFARCEHCEARNKVVDPGVTPSRPGLLPVTGLLD
jgi:hypothetical protein